MPDIKKTYSGDDKNKSAVIEIDESALGLSQFNSLKDIIDIEIENGIMNFVFDMKNLDTINSSGLGILISSLKKIRSSGGKLNFINTNEKISNIFRLTKLDSVFEI